MHRYLFFVCFDLFFLSLLVFSAVTPVRISRKIKPSSLPNHHLTNFQDVQSDAELANPGNPASAIETIDENAMNLALVPGDCNAGGALGAVGTVIEKLDNVI